jgi:dipeptidyl aminopeptidase/acylaminoacyl peptidase
VFDYGEAGQRSLYVIDAEGGLPRRLTPESSDPAAPVWSPDSRSIYFQSGGWGIWKIPAEGGEAVRVIQEGSIAAPSRDGSHLYYWKFDGIWRLPLGGGEATKVLSGPTGFFALSGSGIYYHTQTTQGRRGESAIRYLDLPSGQVTEVFQETGPVGLAGLAVSPDEEWILYDRRPLPTSELMLVENFR